MLNHYKAHKSLFQRHWAERPQLHILDKQTAWDIATAMSQTGRTLDECVKFFNLSDGMALQAQTMVKFLGGFDKEVRPLASQNFVSELIVRKTDIENLDDFLQYFPTVVVQPRKFVGNLTEGKAHEYLSRKNLSDWILQYPRHEDVWSFCNMNMEDPHSETLVIAWGADGFSVELAEAEDRMIIDVQIGLVYRWANGLDWLDYKACQKAGKKYLPWDILRECHIIQDGAKY